MKRILVLLPFLLFAGCAPDPRIDEIRVKAAAICGFLPTVTTVAAILANPGVTGAAQIAQAICNAVAKTEPKQPLFFYAPPVDCPKVNGVCIEGDWRK